MTSTKVKSKKLTQKMSFCEVCKVLEVKDNDIALLWDIVKNTNSATLNHANRVGEIMGADNLQLFRKWLYK